MPTRKPSKMKQIVAAIEEDVAEYEDFLEHHYGYPVDDEMTNGKIQGLKRALYIIKKYSK